MGSKRPYDLTIFKLHCGKLTLKIYSKGERVLRIEAVAHNTQQLNCGRALDKFPEVVARLKGVERFADALSCIDQCFIADDMLKQLPTGVKPRLNVGIKKTAEAALLDPGGLHCHLAGAFCVIY